MVKSILEAIERGEKIAGSQRALAAILECRPQYVADAKKGRCGLPTYQLSKLANYIGEDARELLAFDALDREQDPKKREVMRRIFFSVAAHGALAWICLITTGQEATAKPLTPTVSALDVIYIVAVVSKALKMARNVLSGRTGQHAPARIIEAFGPALPRAI